MKTKLILICLCILVQSSLATTEWQPLAKGLDYTKLPIKSIYGNGYLHAFRVNLNYYSLEFGLAEKLDQKTASISQLAQHYDALVAINAGFFNPSAEFIGLRVNWSQELNPLKKVSWLGVFYSKNDVAKIIPMFQYNRRLRPEFALQVGPRLLINGRIPRLKAGVDSRSAICINQEDNIVTVATTQNAPLSTTDLATLLRKTESQGGLHCRYALNLDGGYSNQLYAHIGNFKLHLPNFSQITDAIIIKEKFVKAND